MNADASASCLEQAVCIFVCFTVDLPALSTASDLCCGWTEEGGDNMGEDMTR